MKSSRQPSSLHSVRPLRRIRFHPAPFCAVLLVSLLAALPAAAATTPISGTSPYPDGGDPSDPAAVTACNARPQIGHLDDTVLSVESHDRQDAVLARVAR